MRPKCSAHWGDPHLRHIGWQLFPPIRRKYYLSYLTSGLKEKHIARCLPWSECSRNSWLQLLESISPSLDIEATRNVLRFLNEIIPSSNALYPQRASTRTGKSKWRVLWNQEGYTNRSSYCETLTSKCSGNERWNILILWELTSNLFLFSPLLNLSNMHQPSSLPWKQSLIFEDSDHIMLEGHSSDHLQFCAKNQNHRSHLASKHVREIVLTNQ